MRSILSLLLLLIISLKAFSQLTLVSIPHPSEKKITSAQARVLDTPLTLPFWDDFSYYTDKKPIGALWSSYNTVTINDGLAVNPLSLKVATFDGYDASGKPYKSGSDILVKGFADSLVSQPIDLSVVPIDKRSTIYFSFYYQVQGNGETPDAGDKLAIYFKSPQGWEEVEAIENDKLDPSTFYFKIIGVPARFISDKFQFRVRSFGRLSGPYDTWNIDYVYMNIDRTAADSSTPDRAIFHATYLFVQRLLVNSL